MPSDQLFDKNSVIGEFTLVEFIGKGTSAVVWKVKDEDENLWAMKIFSPDHGMSALEIDAFKEEFKRTLDLNHENILSGLKYGEFNRRPYILFDLCTKSVGTVIKQRRPKTNQRFLEEEVAFILADVSSALIYLHDEQIIHQDVKPDNILVAKNLNNKERYLLSDFGVSIQLKKTIQKQTQALSKQRSGLSPDYAAPEQFRGESYKASDIFALGVTLFEVCDGDTPSRSNTCTAEALMNGGYIPDIPDMYSSRLDRLIKSCLSIDYDKRPTAKDLYIWSQSYLTNGFWPKETGEQISKKSINHKKILKWAAGFIGVICLVSVGFKLTSKLQGSTNIEKFDALVSNYEYEDAIAMASEHQDVDFFKKNLPKLQLLKSKIKDKELINNEYALFITTDNKMGILKNGQIQIEAEYDDILPFKTEKIITVKKDGLCQYINIEGTQLFSGKTFSTCKNFNSLIEAENYIN